MFDLNIRLASTTEVKRLEEALIHLIHQGERTMSVISDFVAAQNAHNDQIDTAIAALTGDIAELNAEIAQFKTSETLTEDDKAAITVLAARTAGIADKLTALDALTPPAAPNAVPTTEPIAPGTGAPPQGAGEPVVVDQPTP